MFASTAKTTSATIMFRLERRRMKTDILSAEKEPFIRMSAYGSYEARRAKQMELQTLSAAEIEERCVDVSRRKQEIEDEEMDLIRALDEARKREEKKRPDTLTKEDETTLRRSLTVVGNLLAGEDVMHGGFELVDEDPEEMDAGYFGPREVQPYSLDIATGFCLDVCPGLSIKATLKTRNARVREIVREMITSTQHLRDEEKHAERTWWNIDWDYHDRIEVKNPMSSEEYYAKKKE